jgi:two-component system, sensor histidine kinase
MKRRFAELSIHRKLVAVALLVTSMALVVALLGLTIFDVYRYQTRADDDAAALAGIIAENSAAAVTFLDQAAAEETLSTLRVRQAVTRACLYLPNGRLFARYERDAADVCGDTQPIAERGFSASASQPIVRNGRRWGTVYLERDFSGLASRIGFTAVVTALMLALSGVLAFLLAQRLTRGISDPIVLLAAEARRVAEDLDLTVGELPTPKDEVGDLVRAFKAMMVRVRDANAGLRREIDERRRIEAEREALLERERDASRKKDEFVATVSHELRTPLGAILAWTQILEAARPDQRTLDKAVSSIARSAEAQARVIEDLVDVSRIATGKLHLQWATVDLREPIEAAVEVVRPAAQDKDVQIEVSGPSRPCVVKGDEDRLRQVVGNLLSNAVKFSDTGGRITVVTKDMGSTYEVEVTDQGTGIAADMLPHVFDRYRQADSSTTRRFGGLGLGLAIVKEVTELHGGSVGVESDGEGRGAVFRVRLPALMGPRQQQADDGASETKAERLDGVEVLAVDDNAEALDVLATALRGLGAVVRTAGSGPAALVSWEIEPPDVLLCDLAMPEMDGFQVLEEIRRRSAGSSRRTAAIAVSAHATVEHRRRSVAAGFAQHVAKPYRIGDLARAVHEALVP